MKKGGKKKINVSEKGGKQRHWNQFKRDESLDCVTGRGRGWKQRIGIVAEIK